MGRQRARLWRSGSADHYAPIKDERPRTKRITMRRPKTNDRGRKGGVRPWSFVFGPASDPYSPLSWSAETRPIRTAYSAAWVRLGTLSLARILLTWVLTVFSPIRRLRAICLLACPWA